MLWGASASASQHLPCVPNDLVLCIGWAGSLTGCIACRLTAQAMCPAPSALGTCKRCLELLSYSGLSGPQAPPRFCISDHTRQGLVSFCCSMLWCSWSPTAHLGCGMYLLDMVNQSIARGWILHSLSSFPCAVEVNAGPLQCTLSVLNNLESGTGVFPGWHLPTFWPWPCSYYVLSCGAAWPSS